jgi:hypothetical protein
MGLSYNIPNACKNALKNSSRLLAYVKAALSTVTNALGWGMTVLSAKIIFIYIKEFAHQLVRMECSLMKTTNVKYATQSVQSAWDPPIQIA